MPLADLLVPTLRDAPDRIAVLGDGRRLSYRALDEAATQLAAHWLALGLERFDRVALWLPNGPDLLAAYLGCWKAGLIALPIDLRYQVPQVRFLLHDSGARAAVVHAGRASDLLATEYLPRLAGVLTVGGPATLEGAVPLSALPPAPAGGVNPPPFAGDRLCTIFYTSGTTSRPKGVVHAALRTLRRVEKLIDECRLGPDSVSLACLSLLRPLAYQLQALAVLRAGGCVVTLARFSPEAFWRAYTEPPAKTLLAFTPDMLAATLDHAGAGSADFAALRLCLAGADRVPLALHRRFRERTGLALTEVCGMTETGPYAMNPPFGTKKPGSVGVAPQGVLLRIVDERGDDVPPGRPGQIVVRTPDIMLGYWNDTVRTYEALRDGWMYTGDVGRADADGYIWFDGRQKEMIVRDGSNVSPAEVEAALLTHPAVAEAVVGGVDDPPHGQAVEAFVRWQAGVASPSTGQLREYLAARLHAPALPRQVYPVADWPRTGQGKIDRGRLHWIAAAGGVGI
jgi:long-chain acyl-CoA synthetase